MTCGTHPLRAGRKAVIYVRNSTEMQIGNAREGFQREHGEQLARQHGFEHIEVKADLGISGEEIANRPEYMKLLDEIQKGLVGAIIVADISRLSRDRDYVDGWMLYRLCKEKHTVIITPHHVYDPDARDTRNTLAVQLMGASMQKEMNLTALTQGMLKQAERGLLFTGNVPLGYDRQPMPLDIGSGKARTWFVINPVEATLVELVYTTAERMGARKTAMWLNAHGHRFPVKSFKKQVSLGRRHNNGVPMQDRPWCATDVLRVLRSPLYVGIYVWAGKRRDSEFYKDVQKPVEVRMARLRIISEPRWHAMQALLSHRNRDVTPPRSATSPYLFSGLLKCVRCGGPMKGARTRTSDPAKRQRIYRCVAHGEGQECQGDTVREVFVRKAVRRNLLDVIPALGIDAVLDQAVGDTLGRVRSERVISDLETELQRLQEAHQKALNLHYAGRLDDTQIASELDRIEAVTKQTHRKKDVELSKQRNRISAAELREYMGADLAAWVRELQSARLSRVAKLVYRSFQLAARGASHKRQGHLAHVVYTEDVRSLLAETGHRRTKSHAGGLANRRFKQRSAR